MAEALVDIVLNGQLVVAILIAALAGLISFASPCVLPLIPGYLAFVGGTASTDGLISRRRTFYGVALFVLGFSLVFVAYGAAFGSIGTWLLRWQDPLTRVMGAFLILMGIVFVGAIPLMQRTHRMPLTPKIGLAGAPLLGVVFGFGWTPCLGPTLAAISVLSLNSGSPWRGAVLAFAYCLGLGVPFMLAALGFGWAASAIGFLKRHVRAINIVGGVTLGLVGLLMLTGVWAALMSQLQYLIVGTVLPI